MALRVRAYVSGLLWFLLVAVAQSQNFAVADHYATGGLPRTIAIGDLDGDGNQDIVVGDQGLLGAGTLDIFWGNGDGTFAPRQSFLLPTPPFPAGISEPTELVIADLDGDSSPEILVGDAPRHVVIVKYAGNRQFTVANEINVVLGDFRPVIAVGDLNGDSQPDIVIANIGVHSSGSVIFVALNQGSLNFAAPVDYGSVQNPNGIAIGDLNSDGKPDIVVSSAFSTFPGNHNNTVSVFTGNGDGTFQPAVQYPAFSDPLGVQLADFNGDGKLDVAEITQPLGGSGGSTAGLLLNSSGALTLGTSVQTDPSTASLVLADVNQDGRKDFIIAASNVDVILNNGNGTLGAVQAIPVLTAAGDVAAGDLNGDGRIDLAAVNVNSPAMTVILNNGGAAGSPTQTTLTATPNPASFGSDVTLQATVTSNSGTPTGTVAFTVDGSPAGQVALSNGVAALVLQNVHAATHQIRAVYAGNATFAPSSANSSFVMQPIPTTLTLAANPSAPTQGQNVQLTATVQSTSGTPVGNVLLFDNQTLIATVPLLNGQAVFNTSVLAVGPHDILAGYSGNGQDFGPSQAHATVNVGSFFSLTSSNSSLNFTAGSSASTMVTLTGFNNFTEQVNFTCVAPANSVNCAFSPASVTPSNNTASTQLTVTASPLLARSSAPLLPWEMAVIALLGGVFVRRKQRLGVTLALACGLITLGCGGGGSSSTPNSPPAQTTTTSFQVMVVGRAVNSGFQQTTTLNVSVTH
jgi:hypothetical protein